MKTNKTFQLIDGAFSPEEARQILGAMVRHKIDYHTRKQFSDTERFGVACPSHEERVQKLRALEEELSETFKNAEKSGKKLQVIGTIQIACTD